MINEERRRYVIQFEYLDDGEQFVTSYNSCHNYMKYGKIGVSMIDGSEITPQPKQYVIRIKGV